jgi:hypothetical protein
MFTVKELINKLSEMPPDLLVVGEWDSIYVPVKDAYIVEKSDYYQDFKFPVVVLDVELH